MALEIERKWLVDPGSRPFDLDSYPSQHIIQSYLSFHPQIRLRDIDEGGMYLMTVKAGGGPEGSILARQEFEAQISAGSYHDLIGGKVGKTLEKTRFQVPDGKGHIFEIDVYEGEFAGLMVAEMEFDSEEEALAYPDPSWAAQDISTDPAYRNVVMAQDVPPQEGTPSGASFL